MTPNKSNQIIQSLWIGTELTIMEKLCISSYLKNGHDFHLYSYNPIESLPKGAMLLDANTIISADKLFLDSRGGVASFADWFRYKLLYQRGGWWVDMDTVCLKSFDFPDHYCFATEFAPEGTILNIGFIKAQKKSDFLQECIEHIEKQDFSRVKWGSFGSILLRSVLEQYDSKKYIYPPSTFCPISWTMTERLIFPQEMEFKYSTYAVHLWNEIWRLKQLDKNADYPVNCIYENLKRKYMNN